MDGESNALEPAQQVTLKMESGKFVRFQPDTGAQCNVLPVHIYCLATEDEDLHNVVEVQSALVAYGGSRVDVVGEAILRVWRGEKSYRIRCKLVDNESIRPIFGRRACVGLNIIQYTDNDDLNRPRTNGAAVFSTEEVIKKTNSTAACETAVGRRCHWSVSRSICEGNGCHAR